MTGSVISAAVWIVVASIIALLPWKIHWRAAVFLLIPTIVVIIPWLFIQNGVVVGTAFAVGFCSILRWPLYYLTKNTIRKAKVILGR